MEDKNLLINYVNVNLLQSEVIVLKDVNLNVGKGEFVYLIGKVGSGKSTLLKSFYAEVPIASGEVATIFEYDLKKLKRKQIPNLRRRLGIIYQDFQLLIDRTVHDNLMFVLKATGWRKADAEARIQEVLKLVEMENKGYKMPHQLSGGEQQRIVIARAMLNKPDIIVADEPTGHLDPETGEGILKLLRSICKDGTTVIMSTHNLSWLRLYPGRVLKFESERMFEIDENGNEIIREDAPEPKAETEESEEKEEEKEENIEVAAEVEINDKKEEEAPEAEEVEDEYDEEDDVEETEDDDEEEAEDEEENDEDEEDEDEEIEEPEEEKEKAEEKAEPAKEEEPAAKPTAKERPTNIRTTITMGDGTVISGTITDDYGFTEEEMEQKTFNLNKHPRATFKGDGKFVAQSIYDLEYNHGVDVNKDLPIEKVEPKKRLSIPKN
ncbi:MAG: ATP-binding cassette domain-containing protein [Paludibacteraceae bacterium]|nr:ATP-binding cassette domain-containing protein [Paludibacteraceae bacterium]